MPFACINLEDIKKLTGWNFNGKLLGRGCKIWIFMAVKRRVAVECSGSPRLKSRPPKPALVNGTWGGFSGPSEQMSRWYLKWGYGRFLLRLFEVTLHCSFYHLTLNGRSVQTWITSEPHMIMFRILGATDRIWFAGTGVEVLVFPKSFLYLLSICRKLTDPIFYCDSLNVSSI
jgi:hypothetical protein